jgi:tRNA pseudouridine32 synthase/23S rRNA pseudouridine746 synthase
VFEIVANHENFLVINKPPGVSFHKDGKSPGLLDLLRKDYDLADIFAVHRLDKIASGLLLLAKNRKTAQNLSFQFQNRLVGKHYLAVSDRRPKKKQGLIVGDMKRTRRGAWKLLRTQKSPAVTQFFSTSIDTSMRLFLLKPHTGKTHQLRVALRSIGAPILGDPIYHPKERGHYQPDRTYLHCYALCFQIDGEVFRYQCKPEFGRYFVQETCVYALRKYKDPWALNWPSVEAFVSIPPQH